MIDFQQICNDYHFCGICRSALASSIAQLQNMSIFIEKVIRSNLTMFTMEILQTFIIHFSFDIIKTFQGW